MTHSSDAPWPSLLARLWPSLSSFLFFEQNTKAEKVVTQHRQQQHRHSRAKCKANFALPVARAADVSYVIDVVAGVVGGQWQVTLSLEFSFSFSLSYNCNCNCRLWQAKQSLALRMDSFASGCLLLPLWFGLVCQTKATPGDEKVAHKSKRSLAAGFKFEKFVFVFLFAASVFN